MIETTTREFIGKTVVDVSYTQHDDGRCESMYVRFSDGWVLGVGYSSDGSLCSVLQNV
jgi:hypothetical protein